MLADSWKTTKKVCYLLNTSNEILKFVQLNKRTFQEHGEAQGGDYICVHWRRRDFVRSHSADIPSINGTAEQVSVLASEVHESIVLKS